MSNEIAKQDMSPVGSYRDPHLLPYAFARSNGILIGEDDEGRNVRV